jgi:hypothetical protein
MLREFLWRDVLEDGHIEDKHEDGRLILKRILRIELSEE